MNLNRIIIFAANALTCAEFYRDNFNLEPIGEWSPEWAELDGKGCRLAFHQAYGKDGKITQATGSVNHPHKIVFTVDDVEATREKLIANGVNMDEVLSFPELGNLILCDGSDPEGHRFQICNR